MENVAERNSMQNIEVTKDNEMDLVQGLLSAADFRTDDEMQTEIQIKRKGKLFFSFKIRPLSEEELLNARRKSVVKMANPNNPKLPPIEKDAIDDQIDKLSGFYDSEVTVEDYAKN